MLHLENEELRVIEEKPNFHFLVNTGVYVLEPDLFSLVSKLQLLHMTDLIIMAKEKGFKVGVYPYHGQWFDVGQWEEYRQTLRAFESISY
ncbi:hypothetical protein HX99_03380 [Peptococcaceae bacterium SCADC1_2_3]|nr:hypothetical protein DK28_0210200 [Peptococcaceae bacterium SCADC1_2_3]KFI36562.1 hypothetical protein HX99_03380 [Peptococcaceae bacterium SCADC1_2_3]